MENKESTEIMVKQIYETLLGELYSRLDSIKEYSLKEIIDMTRVTEIIEKALGVQHREPTGLEMIFSSSGYDFTNVI